MMDWSERGNIRKRGPSWEPFRKNSLQHEPVMVQRKKETLRRLRKQKEARYNS